MSVSEEMAREQLDRTIAHIELRVDQQVAHASVLTPRGDEVKQAQGGLALMLTELAKLRTLRSQFYKPPASPTCEPRPCGHAD